MPGVNASPSPRPSPRVSPRPSPSLRPNLGPRPNVGLGPGPNPRLFVSNKLINFYFITINYKILINQYLCVIKV